jgi:CCR4-NOT transcription complex subunit 1
MQNSNRASVDLTPGKLASCMRDLGYACTKDEAAFRSLLKQCPSGDVDDQAVAEVLGLLAGSHAVPASEQPGAPSQWNLAVVIDVLKAAKPEPSWQRVAELLDQESFFVSDAPGFATLCAAFKRATGGKQQIPIRAIASGRPWKNALGQISLLRHATAAPPDVYNFEACDRKLPPIEGLQGGRTSVGSPNQAWLCRDLLDTLSALTDLGHFQQVRQVLELPAKSCPEVRP